MKTLYKHAEKLAEAINEFEKENVNLEGKMVRSKEALKTLDKLLKKGLKFYNEIAESKVYETYPVLAIPMAKVSELTGRLQITEANAKKLNMENSFQIWQQLEVALAVLACTYLEVIDNENV